MTIGRHRRLDRLAGLVDEELHAIEFLQQIVGELDVGLVDLVDQQHDLPVGREGVPQLAALDVVADVVEARVAELAVAQPRHRVIFVEALLRLGRRLHMPFDEVEVERRGDLAGELGLAGARLALDQQRPLQRDRRIDRHHQILVGDIGRRAFEPHSIRLSFVQASLGSTCDGASNCRATQAAAKIQPVGDDRYMARLVSPSPSAAAPVTSCSGARRNPACS